MGSRRDYGGAATPHVATVGLAGVEHQIIPAKEMPLVLHGLTSATDELRHATGTAGSWMRPT